MLMIVAAGSPLEQRRVEFALPRFEMETIIPKGGNENLLRFLRRLNSHSVLHDGEQQAILALPAFPQRIEPKYDLVALDEFTDHASLIVDGVVARFDQHSDGTRQISAFHIAGDMANLNSVVQPRAGSALQALSTATILQVPHISLRQIAARFPGVAEAFWRDNVIDAAVLSRWFINVGFHDARTRMAHLLCELATRFRPDGQSKALTFPLPVTQGQMAEATAMSIVHVNRTLQSLKQVVLITRQGVEILDWDRLVELGRFDAGYLHADIQPDQRIRVADVA